MSPADEARRLIALGDTSRDEATSAITWFEGLARATAAGDYYRRAAMGLLDARCAESFPEPTDIERAMSSAGTAARSTPDPTETETMTDSDRKPEILQFFAYAHLPPHLQDASRPFGELAAHIVGTTNPGAEQSTALRKLLESKDAAVRASLPKREG